jgi:DNA-binding transcriptional MerR regulator/quercetin dioxygenase-like cupin family protein
MAARKLLRIGQVARMLRVSASSLRNWERLGLIAPVRSQARYRLYSPEAVRQLKRIQYLRRIKGVNPPGILHMRGGDSELRPLPVTSELTVGERLVRLRHQQGLSRADAAARAGLSLSVMRTIERGTTVPSVATLQKLARVYRTKVLAFFDAGARPSRLVRPHDRGVLAEQGVRMELLAFGALQMEPHLFRTAPRATSGGAYQHEGEEFIYMMSGKFEIWLDELEHYVLQPGDSLYFPSHLPHRWRTVGEDEAVLLWINSPSTF